MNTRMELNAVGSESESIMLPVLNRILIGVFFRKRVTWKEK